VFAVMVLLGLSGAIMAVTLGSNREHGASLDRQRAFFSAGSGLSHVLANLEAGSDADVGAADAPIAFSGGSYWARVIDNGDQTYTVTSTGSLRGTDQAIQAVVGPVTGGIFNNAIFAGNEDEDPLYELDLGGFGAQADMVDGDIFSGGDVVIAGDASVTGDISAGGAITGGTGNEGASQPLPDLDAMNYPAIADVDVLNEFLTGGPSYSYDDAGGSAWQLPESNPAHIFRVNPSDRQSDVDSTTKHDFFLEDPYEPVKSDSGQDGSNAYEVTFSGVDGAPGPNTNEAIFYIDGNLWLHNKKSFSLGIGQKAADGIQVTFVVRGNVYFSDNFFYGDKTTDGVAFIAMEDPNVPDSGNIYFGDPVFGTLEAMQAYMYAENNFYDNNLDEAGSAEVELFGIMSAGNQVNIERDYGTQHSKLTVEFDDRVKEGELEIPGMPGFKGGGGSNWQILSWRRVGDA
jgi:hypothetical protein